MNSNLAQQLIEKGIIRQGTVFTARYNAYGLSCVNNATTTDDFVVDVAKKTKDGQIVFDVLNSNKNPARISADDIIAMDGMDFRRVANIYELTEDGQESKATGKRRGRKPQNADTFE